MVVVKKTDSFRYTLIPFLLVLIVLSFGCKSTYKYYNEHEKSQHKTVDYFNHYFNRQDVGDFGVYVEQCLNNDLVPQEDKDKIIFGTDLLIDYPYLSYMRLEIMPNSYEDKTVRVNTYLIFGPQVNTGMGYPQNATIYLDERNNHCLFVDNCIYEYLKRGDEVDCTVCECQNRLAFMWLNDEIDELYSYEELVEICDEFNDFLNNDPYSKETEWKSLNDKYPWIYDLANFKYDMEKCDSESKENACIFNLLVGRYLDHNSNLLNNMDKKDLGSFLMDHYYDFFRIYKDNQDVYFSENTDETMLFDNLDNALMKEYNLTVDDLR